MSVSAAVKRIDKASVKSEAQIRRVFAEKHALAACSSCPFIVQLLAVCQDEKTLSYVLELVPGGTLAAHIRAAPDGRLPLDAAKFYAAELAVALRELHAAGFGWRDAKAGNVLLDADGHVRVVDLGFACEVSVVSRGCVSGRPMPYNGAKDSAAAFVGYDSPFALAPPAVLALPTLFTCLFSFPLRQLAKRDGWAVTYLGTPQYMAPEVLAAQKKTAAGERHRYRPVAADWWAFGVLLHEMLTGSFPAWASSRKEDVAALHTFSDLRLPAGAIPNAHAQDLVRRLLTVDVAARADQAAVFAHAWFADVDWDTVAAKAGTPPPMDASLATWTAQDDVPLTAEQEALFAAF